MSRRNIIFERAKFNSRKQEEGESADTFITPLYGLAEHCGFGQLHDKLIRDCIVVGIRDVALSEKLQLDPNLDLQKAVNAVRQSKIVKKQQATVRGTATDDVIDAVHKAKLRQKLKKATHRCDRTQGNQHIAKQLHLNSYTFHNQKLLFMLWKISYTPQTPVSCQRSNLPPVLQKGPL